MFPLLETYFPVSENIDYCSYGVTDISTTRGRQVLK